jgi:hypothetical protein
MHGPTLLGVAYGGVAIAAIVLFLGGRPNDRPEPPPPAPTTELARAASGEPPLAGNLPGAPAAAQSSQPASSTQQ